MAYTSAEVHNPAEATVVQTDWALLALECNEGAGFNDETCWVDQDGRLYLNFAKGRAENPPGGGGNGPTVGEPYLEDDKWYVDVTLEDQTEKVFLVDREVLGIVVRRVRTNGLLRVTDSHCYIVQWEFSPYSIGEQEWSWISSDDLFDPRQACFDAAPASDPEPASEPGSGLYGFQPGSTYEFEDLVKVTNNSVDTIDIGYTASGNLFNESVSFIHAEVTLNKTRLGSGEFAYISFIFRVPGDWAERTGKPFGNPFDGTLTVTARPVTAGK